MTAALKAAPKLEIRALSRFFRALGDETRVRIVALLSHGELCVCHIEEALGLQQSTASRQLSVLRAAGVVEARREASWVYYRLAPQTDELCKKQLGELARGFAKKDTLRRDVERLLKVKGPGKCA
jgi:ArsR family transcriptional regulator, arsenate/arsenite/antimonite-responsive transcriptional repressor